MYINGYLCGMWQVARELKKVTKKIGLNYIVCMYVGVLFVWRHTTGYECKTNWENLRQSIKLFCVNCVDPQAVRQRQADSVFEPFFSVGFATQNPLNLCGNKRERSRQVRNIFSNKTTKTKSK